MPANKIHYTNGVKFLTLLFYFRLSNLVSKSSGWYHPREYRDRLGVFSCPSDRFKTLIEYFLTPDSVVQLDYRISYKSWILEVS
jgi:hypothetical protein